MKRSKLILFSSFGLLMITFWLLLPIMRSCLSGIYGYYNPSVSGEVVPQILIVEPSDDTIQKNQSPMLEGSPHDWLLGTGSSLESDLIPVTLQMYEGSFTNEDVAAQYPNSAEILANLEKWGRVTSSVQSFLHLDGCKAKDSLRAVKTQVVLYKTAEEAQLGLEWSNSMINPYRFTPTNVIGEKGGVMWWDSQSDCTPADTIKSIRIAFRRYNVVGVVDVGSLVNLADEGAMEKLAIALAQIIDAKLISAAQ